MKAVDACTHDFYYDNHAVNEARALSNEMADYYEYLQCTALPDEVRLTITGIDGLTVVDEEAGTVVGATIRQVRAECAADGALRCVMVLNMDENLYIYRHAPERGWTVNGDAGDDESVRMTHADVVGELARWIETSHWPESARHYLDRVELDSREFICFIEDVLLPQASHFRKELAYNASDYGALSTTPCGDTRVSLRSVTEGRVRGGEPQTDEDYVYLTVDQPTLENGTPAQVTQAIVKSAFGTTSTDSLMDDGRGLRIHHIDQPEVYLRTMKAGLGVLQAQKTVDMIIAGNELSGS
ncbi:MAG TPA: hypothetical protein PKV96_01875 [Candidatus Saccharimonas sp.]|nr:hypothetical protein [Candidatus Saccharimonas sp.]